MAGAALRLPLACRNATTWMIATTDRRLLRESPERRAHVRTCSDVSRDPANADQAIDQVRRQVAGDPRPGLEGTKLLMLLDRNTGKGIGITLFESEDAMRRGDEALNQMNPTAGSRTSVEFYEVPVTTL
jgi:hypothetical protein